MKSGVVCWRRLRGWIEQEGARLIEHPWLLGATRTQFLFNSTFDFIKNHQLAKAWIPNSTKRLKQCLHIFVYFFNSIITEDLTCFFIQWRVISRDIFTKEIEKQRNRDWDSKIRFGLENVAKQVFIYKNFGQNPCQDFCRNFAQNFSFGPVFGSFGSNKLFSCISGRFRRLFSESKNSSSWQNHPYTWHFIKENFWARKFRIFIKYRWISFKNKYFFAILVLWVFRDFWELWGVLNFSMNNSIKFYIKKEQKTSEWN